MSVTRNRLFRLGLVLIVVVLLAWPAAAASVKTWRVSREDQLAEGTLDGTAVDGESRVVLAPSIETLWGPEEGVVWSVEPTLDGAAFVALSGPGRLVRVGPDGSARVWYSTGDEGLITAVSADGEGGAYIGVSPGGQVIHITAPDQGEILETGTTFIWTMARDIDGTIWFGTGTPGVVYREQPDGNVEAVYETGDDPVRCMAALPGGGVVIGTGGRGRVIRVDDLGYPFVLYDADESEIVDIAVSSDGEIFALTSGSPKAIGGNGPQPNASNSVTVTATPPPTNGDKNGQPEQHPEPKRPPQPQRFRGAAGGALYRISEDGGVRRIWQTTKEIPFAVHDRGDGELLIATGDSGRIYLLDREGRATRLLRIRSNQASALAPLGEGVLIGGTTDARLELLRVDARRKGTYLGPVVDAGTVADWGRLRWDASLPRGSTVKILVRAGNSGEPDETWSPWVSLGGVDEQGELESGLRATRWAQIRLDLESAKNSEGPQVRRLELRYLPRNRAPRALALKVERAGVVWVKGPAQPANRFGPFVTDDPVSRQAAAEFQPQARPNIRKSYELGARTFGWSADDPDGDRISFDLEIRREGSVHWFPLARELTERFFSWDARGMPDGHYRARVVASDRADNPDGKQLTDERVSVVFAIDNTRPVVARTDLVREPEGLRVGFEALDPGGSVASVEVAVDGGGWLPLDPVDGVSDSAEEHYELVVDGRATEGTPRSVMVRVTDSVGNLGGEMWILGDDAD